MNIEFGAAKDQANRSKHGVSLGRAADFDLGHVGPDNRADYGEPGFIGFGFLDGTPHCLVFTARDGKVRPISVRRSHSKEFARYFDLDQN